MADVVIYATVYAGTSKNMLARLEDVDGAVATQSDFSGITCIIEDMTTGVAVTVIEPSVVVSTSIFDTLQTDGQWDVDTTGYNFRHLLPVTAFPTAGHVYRVTYTATPTAGASYIEKFKYQVTVI